MVNCLDQLTPLQQHLVDVEAVLGQLLSAVLRMVVLQQSHSGGDVVMVVLEAGVQQLLEGAHRFLDHPHGSAIMFLAQILSSRLPVSLETMLAQTDH